MIDQVSIWKIHPPRRITSGILGETQKQLFDKDSPSGDAIKSITPPNEKDDAYIDSLNNQQTNNKLYIQQTLPGDFFLG